MTELVYLKNGKPFTDSLTIAQATEIQHKSVVRTINSKKKLLEAFGEIRFSDLKSTNPLGGRPTKNYLLSEPQATLLITFLDNSEKVDLFKQELVRQFYAAKEILNQRQTEEWIETRRYGKITRKSETDIIQQLVEYAKEQGSTHSEMLYMTYSKLANKIAEVKDRDIATIRQLNNLELIERIILFEIDNGMVAELDYKDIYQRCKKEVEHFRDFTNLNTPLVGVM